MTIDEDDYRQHLEAEVEDMRKRISDLESCIDRAINELKSDDPEEALRCLEGRWR